jgi:OPA family sugar phosphate sensor protein UhpC-like MFS transporter
MGLFSRIRNFYAISAPIEQSDDISTPSGQKRYRRLAMQSFVAATIGYSLYYVCRTSLNVMKKPIIDSGFLDAAELGIIGSALLFAYAIGKFINGFMCDYCNIKRFMMTGLTISLSANLAMGILGFVGSAIPTFAILVIFATLWGINGWSQSMGSPPAIISLSRWFRVGAGRLSATLSVKNLLGSRNIVYDGYEPSRIRNYYSGEQHIFLPQDDVLTYAYPRTLYAVISWKF